MRHAGDNGHPRGSADPEGKPRVGSARMMRALSRISALGASRGAPEELASRALREFALGMGFRRAEIVLLDRRNRMLPLASYGAVRTLNGRTTAPLPLCAFGRRLLRTGRMAMSPPRNGRPRCHLRWRRADSVFAAPLGGPSGPVGLLFADGGGRRVDLESADLAIASALKGLIGEILTGSVGRQREARRTDGLVLLHHVGRAISSEESLPVLLPRLTRMVQEGCGVLGVVVALYDARLSEFEVAGIAGPPAVYGQGYRFSAQASRQSISPRILRSGRPLRIPDQRKAPDICLYWAEARSILVLPIRSQGKILGTLRLEETRPGAFDDEDVRLCSTLADLLGHAVRRARVIEALHRHRMDLRTVSDSLERRLEEERRRIARELHDEVAQSMTAAKINLGLLRRLTRGQSAEVRQAIRETEAVVIRTIKDTRRIAMDLRPAILDDLGLVPALRWYAAEFARRTRVAVDIQADGGPSPAQGEFNTLLFRFFQEALTNVARHARARKVRIGLSRSNGTLRAFVADDGVGMDPGAPRWPGLGLLGMRERVERAGGLLRIQAKPGQGTRLVAEIPVRAPERTPHAS